MDATMTGDRITLTGIRARGFHGVFDHERAEGQEFVVDVVVGIDHVKRIARHDDVALTVDYGAVARIVVEHVTGEPVDLIETLAHRIAVAVSALRRVRWAQVTVHKPQAPITLTDGTPIEFADASVTVTRESR